MFRGNLLPCLPQSWHQVIRYCRCVVGVVGSGDWCNHDSGYSTITDSDGYPRGVYVSARRDGSVWLRFGRDHASLEWTYVDERRERLQTVILHDDDLALLRVRLILVKPSNY